MLHRPYLTELFLTRSWARPRLLFVLQRDNEWSFFSSPQLQNPYGKSSLAVSADFHVKFSRDMCPLEFRGPTSGLIYFSSIQISAKKGWDVAGPMVFNPRTRQYASLPKVETDIGSNCFLGYDPIDKQFKVLSVLECSHDHMVLTLGTGEMSWRKIHCPIQHYCAPYSASGEGICINGVLYYLAKTLLPPGEPRDDYAIVCFDVRSETFKFIELEPFKAKLINYKGKLGRISWKNDGITNELHMWVLEDVQKQEWSKHVYNWKDYSSVSVVGVTSAGEIVLSNGFTSIFYYSPERKTLQRVEILGFGEYYDTICHDVSVFVDYVEDLNVTDAKYLKSSQRLNIIRQRPKLPQPRKFSATQLHL